VWNIQHCDTCTYCSTLLVGAPHLTTTRCHCPCGRHLHSPPSPYPIHHHRLPYRLYHRAELCIRQAVAAVASHRSTGRRPHRVLQHRPRNGDSVSAEQSPDPGWHVRLCDVWNRGKFTMATLRWSCLRPPRSFRFAHFLLALLALSLATFFCVLSHNRCDAVVYAVMCSFSCYGAQAFDPSTSNSVMTALLLHDLNDPTSAAQPSAKLPRTGSPLELFAECAVHGGTFRSPFKTNSYTEVAALVYFADQATPYVVGAGAALAGGVMYRRSRL
jgi:hypothetical protein